VNPLVFQSGRSGLIALTHRDDLLAELGLILGVGVQPSVAAITPQLTFPPDQLVFLSLEKVVRLWEELKDAPDDQFFDTFDSG